MASERELLSLRLCDKFANYGLMGGPTASGPELKTSPTGKPVRRFSFSIPRVLDGSVDIFGLGFILVKWQMGAPYVRSEVLRSEDEVEEWLKNRGWVGSGSTYESTQRGGENGG